MIQRYDLETVNYETLMEEWDQGQWVRWDDVKDKLIDWQPIETCPKDGEKLISGKLDDGNRYITVCIFPEAYIDPTHWSPLPALPKE